MKRSNVKLIAQVAGLLIIIAAVLLVYKASGSRQQEQGKTVYETNCANCHGKNGEGLRQLIPPLNDPHSLELSNLVCTIRYGKTGPITVNGKSYDRRMPSNFKMENDEIVAVINYIYNDLNGMGRKVTLPEVSAALDACK